MSTTNNGGSKDGWVEIVAGVGKVEITGNVVSVTSFSGDLVPGEIEFDQIDDAIEQSRRDLAEMRRAMTEEARPLPKPPKWCAFMASLLIPFDRKNDRLGDLEEEFGTKWLPEHGPRRATAIYVTQALYMVVRASLIPALIGWLIRAFQK